MLGSQGGRELLLLCVDGLVGLPAGQLSPHPPDCADDSRGRSVGGDRGCSLVSQGCEGFILS